MKILTTAPIIFVGQFLLVYCFSLASGEYYPYSENYFLYLFNVFSFFFVFYLSGRRTCLPMLRMPVSLKFASIMRLFQIGVFLGLFFNGLNHYMLLGPQFYMPSNIEAYRRLLTIDGGSPPIPGIAFFNIFFFTAPIFLISYKERLSFRYSASLISAILGYVYLSSARSSLFVLILLVFYFCILDRRLTLKLVGLIVILPAFAIMGFAIIGSIVGKPVSSLPIDLYIIAPSHAFDFILNNESTNELDGVWLSFRPLQSLIALLGVNANASNLPNIYTPYPTNVYTIFGVYVNDYGVYGSFAFFSFFGFLSGMLEAYRCRAPESVYIKLLVSLNLTVLTLSIFYDYYTSSGFVWMIVACAWLIFPRNISNRDRRKYVSPANA